MRRFTDEEKIRAVDLYFDEKLTTGETVERLGYPTRQNLERWLKRDPRYGETFCHGFYSVETKVTVVERYRAGKYTAKELAQEFHIGSAAVVLNWVHKAEQFGYDGLIPKQRSAAMPKRRAPDVPENIDELVRRCKELEIDNAILRETIETLKKDPRVDPRDLSNREKTQVIGALKTIYPIYQLMKKVGITRSSYYFHQFRLKKPDPHTELRIQIGKIFEASRQTYGYRRIWMALRSCGVRISEKIVRRLMLEEGLLVASKKRRRYSSYKGEITPAPANSLCRDFHADQPNEKWLTDITEMAAADGKVYLSPIIDCFDGMVVTWKMSRSPNAHLTNGMLKKAIEHLTDDSKPILHTDRGVHYRWPSWIQIVEEAGLIRSMSKKACSPDNAACEGFFGRLKNEMYFDKAWERQSTAQLMSAIDEYIKWYNNHRIKMSLGGKSPVQYRASLGLVSV